MEPLAHLLDCLIHLGYPTGAQDERVPAVGQRVDFGGDLEVRESAAELGAVVGEGPADCQGRHPDGAGRNPERPSRADPREPCGRMLSTTAGTPSVQACPAASQSLPGTIDTTTLPALVRPCSTCAIASSVRSKGKVLSMTGWSFPLS